VSTDGRDTFDGTLFATASLATFPVLSPMFVPGVSALSPACNKKASAECFPITHNKIGPSRRALHGTAPQDPRGISRFP